jgi:hypothetical protein
LVEFTITYTLCESRHHLPHTRTIEPATRASGRGSRSFVPRATSNQLLVTISDTIVPNI